MQNNKTERPGDVLQDMISSLTMGQYGQLSTRQDSKTTSTSRIASGSNLGAEETRRDKVSVASNTGDVSEPIFSIFSDLLAETVSTEDAVTARASPTLASRLMRSVPTISSDMQATSSQLMTATTSAREFQESQEARVSLRSTVFPTASKERGDRQPSDRQDRYSHTPQSFSHLLASRLSHSPNDSRSTSYSHGNVNLSSKQALPDKSSLHHHLYTQGLLAGKHSDISILAFQHRYKLHRLVLDRAPFFTTALSGPWLESSAHEIELFPEDTDQNISQAAFELALKYLYGCDITADADAEAIALFATGCWLDMPDLIGLSITSILKQLHSDMLSSLINILSDHYYGRFGERILESAKAMLCRDGWEMPLKHWDGIPGEIVCEIVGGDGFFVQGEWERWVLAKRLLDRRLKHLAIELDLLDAKSTIVVRAPHFLVDRARVRNPATSTGHGKNRELSEADTLWAELYAHSGVTTILTLLETGIHYIHLDFEQLQYIRGARDIFDLPVLPDMTISDALWTQMELRQRVVNAKDTELELGLGFMTSAIPLGSNRHGRSKVSGLKESASASHKEREDAALVEAMRRRGRKTALQSFVVPTSDCNIVWGADDIAMLTSQPRHNRFAENADNIAAKPIDSALPPDPRRFFAYPSEINDSSWQTPADMRTATNSPSDPVLRTTYPPFRFAVEFPNPRALKERKRVYSRTIFYAGSLWNIYIQKVRSQKNPQLGVYLHRARERGQTDASLGGVQPANSSVDDRISTLERDMVTRGRDRGANLSARRTFIRQRSLVRRYGHYIPPTANVTAGPAGNNANVTAEQDADSLRSANTHRTMGRPIVSYPDGQIESYITLDSDSDDDDYMYDGETSWANWSTSLRSNLSPSRHLPNPYLGWPVQNSSSRNATAAQLATGTNAITTPGADVAAASSTRPTASGAAASLPRNQPTHRRSTPTLPPYSDPRPTIKTYFKIYVPSKGGRMLSVYESAPDKFDFSQSWGWRSGSLMLDEGVEGSSGGSMPVGEGSSAVDLDTNEPIRLGLFENPTGADDSTDGGSGSATKEAQGDRDSRWRRRGEGSLRFMIVIGNL